MPSPCSSHTPPRFVPKRSKPQCARGDAPNAKHRPTGKRNVHTATSRDGAGPVHSTAAPDNSC